jgi:hypothetical protein
MQEDFREKRIAGLEKKIEGLKRRLPAHSIPAAMMQELEDLEEELKSLEEE